MAFVVCAGLAGVAGVLLVAGRGNRVARWLAGVGAGMALGLGFSHVYQLIWTFIEWGNEGIEPGGGFWMLVVTVLLSIAAIAGGAVSADGQPRLPYPAGRGSETFTGVGAFLIGTALLSVVGIVLYQYFGYGSGLFGGFLKSTGLPLLLTVPAAFVMAVILFAGREPRGRGIRLAASVIVGLIFGTALVRALNLVPPLGDGGGSEREMHFSWYILLLAALLPIGAIIAGAVSKPVPAGPVSPPMQGSHLPPQMPGYIPAPMPTPFGHNATPLTAPAPLAKPVEPPRMAKVYDGKDAKGKPIVERPPVNPQMRDALLAYLESAPVVLAARSTDIDEFAPADRDVPLNFRTDGVWVWAGAVPHYLLKHGLAPEPELVRHIVGRGFRVGEVDEATQQLAVRVITGT
ncbi:hypothetical protein [Nocardia sp. NPDC127526]|uniref:hypothetical protein n=1 Tax=Nocardia sp. NPDC127526 TaxID=3345393 RepID=UPI00363E334F